MSNYILTSKSVILCPHGGYVTNLSNSSTIHSIDGGLPLLLNDYFAIGGCHQCNTVLWSNPSSTYFVNGAPALTSKSIGICCNHRGTPTGAALIRSFQTEVAEPQNLSFY